MRIPSQQSLGDKPEADQKSDRKSDCKQDAKKRRMTPKSENFHLLKTEKTSLGKLSFVEDELKSEVQKGNFHKNYREIKID